MTAMKAIILLLLSIFLHGAVSFKSPKTTVTSISSSSKGSHPSKEPHDSPLLSLRGGGRAGADDDIPKLEKKKLPKGTYSAGKALEIHKAMWLPVSLAFNYHFQNFSHRSCLMTALFGGYGIQWVLKSHTFFDKRFYNSDEAIGGISIVFLTWTLLSLFFLFPYLAAKNLDPITPVEVLASVLLYSLGTFFHYGSDAQKHYTLKYRGSGLITDGFFSKLTCPSYFGEDLIWASYVIVAGVKDPLVWIPAALTLVVLVVEAGKKSSSLARYPEYEEWKKKTWF